MVGLAALLIGRLGWRFGHHVAPDRPVAAASAITVVDGRGKRITLPASPRRLVSLAPGITEMLFAIGLKGRIVADTTYCDFPAEAKALPKIGDYITSVEKVVAMKPDMVVASASGNRKAIAQIEQLKSVRIPVFAVDPKNLLETEGAILLLGKATGQTAPAERVVQGMETRLKTIQKTVAQTKERPKALMIVQFDPLFVVGADNFQDDLLFRAGGVNVARKAGPGWPPYSPERVVADRPDVILCGRSDIPRVRSRAGWSGLPAVQRNAIYTTDSNTTARPGPRLVDGLEAIARLLHPRAFATAR